MSELRAIVIQLFYEKHILQLVKSHGATVKIFVFIFRDKSAATLKRKSSLPSD